MSWFIQAVKCLRCGGEMHFEHDNGKEWYYCECCGDYYQTE